MKIDNINENLLAPKIPNNTEKTSKEEFLTLLVAQLENQNPLEPQSGAEFIAQLAQFASVEQSEKTNTLLSQIQSEQVSASNAGMAGLVGKLGVFDTDSVTIDDASLGGAHVEFEITSGKPSGQALIYNSEGKEIRSIELGVLSPGDHSIRWDGTDHLGHPVEDGSYRIEVRLTSPDGVESTAPISMAGSIEAIDFSTGYPMMRVGGALFAPADVLSIR